ncbi:MAG: hypothetical protein ACJAU0_001589 [Flavobacteriales bacterium]|jgi:hypothetical protein
MSHGPRKYQKVSNQNGVTNPLLMRQNSNRKKMKNENELVEDEEGYVCRKGSLIASFLHFFKPSAEE